MTKHKYCKKCSHGKSYHIKNGCTWCKAMVKAEQLSGEFGHGQAFYWSREIIPKHKFKEGTGTRSYRWS